MAGPRIRRDVGKLAEWDEALLWYARAVGEMQKRRLDDATGWRFQAAIHEYIAEDDPLAVPDDARPSAAIQARFWTRCQHNSWYFLPWHRMYLLVFEQIVAATIEKLGGPAGWSLPYWQYSDRANADARRLPAAFRAERLPDGAPNPLRVEARNQGCNDGEIIADDQDVDIRKCLREKPFAGTGAGSPGFGGGRTDFNHGGGVTGQVDRVPHGSMHVAVGGWMGGFNTAGLDPVFWLHHANIDRLWTVWLKRDPQHLNPSEARWRTALPFQFMDALGTTVSFTPMQVIDTTALPSPYRYEDETDPLAGGIEVMAERAATSRRRAMTDRIPEMVGATEQPITLAGQPISTRLSATPPTGPAREAALSEAGAEIYLNVENATSSGPPMSYTLYVNLPPGANPEDHPELRAGVLPMFGVREASRADGEHAGNGLHYALEVGDLVRTLRDRNDWDPDDIRLTFVPKHRGTVQESAAIAAATPIRIGRVSLYIG